jgi:hypothetical protein
MLFVILFFGFIEKSRKEKKEIKSPDVFIFLKNFSSKLIHIKDK